MHTQLWRQRLVYYVSLAMPCYHHVLLVSAHLSSFRASPLPRSRDNDIEQRLAQVERGARGARFELAALSQHQKKADERDQELGHRMDQLAQRVDSLEARVVAHSVVMAYAQGQQSGWMAQTTVLACVNIASACMCTVHVTDPDTCTSSLHHAARPVQTAPAAATALHHLQGSAL